MIKIYTKIYQNCTVFSKFSHVAYAPEPLAHMSANKLYLFFYENSHFSFKVYTKTHQS